MALPVSCRRQHTIDSVATERQTWPSQSQSRLESKLKALCCLTFWEIKEQHLLIRREFWERLPKHLIKKKKNRDKSSWKPYQKVLDCKDKALVCSLHQARARCGVLCWGPIRNPLYGPDMAPSHFLLCPNLKIFKEHLFFFSRQCK